MISRTGTRKNYRIWFLPTSGISSWGISQGKIVSVNWLLFYRFFLSWEKKLEHERKNMINLVVWIWQYLESETLNAATLTTEIKTQHHRLSCPAKTLNSLLPIEHSIFSSSRLCIFLIYFLLCYFFG